MEQLAQFSIFEASNICQFCAEHYLWDFFARIKTAADILSLMVNHLFELGLNRIDCSLEKKELVKA